METSLTESALAFARERHAGQVRKDGRSPYVVHPTRVGEILRTHGVRDEELLAAAVLHDTVEDTATSLDEIRARFGDRVARIVDAVTRRPDQTRRDFTAQMETAPAEAVLVKLADRLDNLDDWQGMDPSYLPTYALEAVDIVRAALGNPRLTELPDAQLKAVLALAVEVLRRSHETMRVRPRGRQRRG